MESSFDNREFEQYVKRNADQYRMIPSEKVWRGINASLHTRRRWYGFGLTLLLLLTAVSVTWVMVSYPTSKKQQITSAERNKTPLKTHPANKGQITTPVIPNEVSGILSFNKFTKQDVVLISYKQLSEPVNKNHKTDTPALEVADNNKIADNKTNDRGSTLQKDKPSGGTVVERKEATSSATETIRSISIVVDIPVSDKKNVPGNKTIGLLENKQIKNNLNHYPLSIDNVIKNTSGTKRIDRRLKWQLYFAPTVSYRKLSVNKSYQGDATPFNAVNYPFASSKDVNGEVVHKPDMGLELGISTKYPLTKYLKLSAGLQFNINRYDIKAFAYYGEQATINLNGGNGSNSLTAWTYYRNYDGYKSDWLKNYYFSVSAPIGAELRLFGNDRTYFGVAGTVQPTYILKDRAFLISTDYKNYVEIPRLIRDLNVNTSLETFISYTSHNAKTRWQIGPQIRYQVLSSFKNKYPVKENLFDFGLRVGISRNK